MTAITLAQADRLIDAILARGADCRPLAVIVVEPGCKVKAFKKEDDSSMIRLEMAYGKAYAALAMGRSSKLVKVRAEEKPIFMRYLIAASGEQIFHRGWRVCRFATGRARSSARSASPAIRRSATRNSPPMASTRSGSNRRGLCGPGTPARHSADRQVTTIVQLR